MMAAVRSRSDGRQTLAAWALAAAMSLGCKAPHRQTPTPPWLTGCQEVITEDGARAVFRQLVATRGLDRCVLVDLDTRGSIMRGRWTRGGVAIPEIVVVPAGCAPRGMPIRGSFAVQMDPRFTAACPSTAAAVQRTFSQIIPAFGDESGGSSSRAREAFSVLALGTLGLLLALGVRAARRPSPLPDAPWRAALFATFALAVVIRLWIPPALSNWYAEALGDASHEITTRFGPGFAVLQTVLRATLPWSDTTLFRADALIGALSIPLFVALLRERGVERITALAVGALFALAPFHVRVSASASEHVLASTLTFGSLLAWVRGVARRDRLLVALALALMALASLTRADVWPQLAVVPLWSSLRDRDERPEGWRRKLAFEALYGAAWLLTGAGVYLMVVSRSDHPAPEVAGMILTTRQFFWQYVPLSFRVPRWFSPVATILAVPGALVMLRRRPALLACSLATLAACFIPLGRNFLHDELLSARYFLLSIPVFLLPAGFGFRACVGAVERRLPGWVSPIALAALGVSAFLSCLSGYRARYTFQDEYSFLRRHATELPAGCTVLQLELRDSAFERDLDCCLDAPRSPLRAAFPGLRFESIQGDPTSRASAHGHTRCEVYFEGAACSMAPTPLLRAERPRSFDLLRQRCDAVHAAGGLVPIATAVISARASNPVFSQGPPRVGLYRWTPGR